MRRKPQSLRRTITLAILALSALSATAKAEPTLAPIDKLKSSIVVTARDSGFLGFGGASHAILATRWFAALRLDRKKLSASNVELAVSTEVLEVDTPDAFRAAGLENPPAREKAEKTETEFKGPQGLDAAKFPMIRFSGESVIQKSESELIVKGKLTLHGVTRDIEAPVKLSPAPNETQRFQAVLKLNPRDFGIALKLRDNAEVRVDFTTEPETVVARR